MNQPSGAQELLILETQDQTTEEIFERIEVSEVERTNLALVFNIFCGTKRFREGELRCFDASDVRRVLQRLDSRGALQQELEQMIWEVDENLDQKVDEQEFQLMYKKCIEDKLHLEPNGLFLLTLFLMYCKKTVGERKEVAFEPSIVSEDTYALIYARFDRQLTDGGQREKLDQEIKMIFDDRERNPDGTDRSIGYREFVDRTNESIIAFRREFKEKQRNLARKEKSVP